MWQTFAIGLNLALTAIAQTSTTNVFLPIIDSQSLVASLSKADGDTKTLIVQCPDGTDSNKCGFPTPVTVTAGPSTVALTTTIGNSMTVDLKCGIEASTKASCTQVFTGPASLYTKGDEVDGSKITTWTASQPLESGNVKYVAVTITAGVSTTTGGTSEKNMGPAPTRVIAPAIAFGLAANVVAWI